MPIKYNSQTASYSGYIFYHGKLFFMAHIPRMGVNVFSEASPDEYLTREDDFDFSDRYLLCIFPEAKSYLKKKQKEINKLKREVRSDARKVRNNREMPKKDKRFRLAMKNAFLRDLEKEEKFVSRTLRTNTTQSYPQVFHNLDVEKAREYPITDLVSFTRSGFAKCLWHDEKTPSMKRYKNHVYCFGCHKYGDVIDVMMKLEGLDFKDSVRRLM